MIDKTLDVVVGYNCNNNCIFCLNPLIKPRDLSFDEIKEQLVKQRGNLSKIEFIGGEPTIRKDIFKVVSLAKELGFHSIRISTNGRMYSYYSFCKKISKCGVNSVSFSLYGSNEKIHDAATRTPGSFNNTLAGIKNAIKEKNINEVFVDTVIYKGNYNNIMSIADLLIELKVKRWQICDLIPEGVARTLYNGLSVSLNKLNILNTILGKVSYFDLICFIDFPHCIFSKEIRENNKIKISGLTDRVRTHQMGYTNERMFFEKHGEFEKKYKIKCENCKNCILNDECGGIWRKYFELFGEEGLKDLKRINRI